MDSKTQLTIFTPTYNRAYILPCLYESLCNQTDKNFEWLIIDDGSTDETATLVKKWIENSRIRITYQHQENAGKHIAINEAAEICVGTWMCIVDSDDHLTESAVGLLNSLISEEQDNESIIGFAGPRGDLNGSKIYGNWPDIRYARFQDLYDKYGFEGETIIVLRSDVVRMNKFPRFEGEKFIPENVLYKRINDKGVFRMFPDIIYCFEYRNDGYSKNGLRTIVKNPKGSMLSRQLEVYGERPIIYRAKCKAIYDAIGIVLKPDIKESAISSGNLAVDFVGILLRPYYVIKLEREVKRNAGQNT